MTPQEAHHDSLHISDTFSMDRASSSQEDDTSSDTTRIPHQPTLLMAVTFDAYTWEQADRHSALPSTRYKNAGVHNGAVAHPLTHQWLLKQDNSKAEFKAMNFWNGIHPKRKFFSPRVFQLASGPEQLSLISCLKKRQRLISQLSKRISNTKQRKANTASHTPSEPQTRRSLSSSSTPLSFKPRIDSPPILTLPPSTFQLTAAGPRQ